ncbi:hypothetical protein Tco_1062987 [Tanacetum coccineum]
MKSVKNVTEEEIAEYENEKEELRLSLMIVSGDDSEVNYEPLSERFHIVKWEYKLLGNVDAKDMYVYKLTRTNGSSSYHGDLQAFLRRLDRQDLNDLYRLVQERFQDHPLKGHDLLLWGDLRMLFDPDEKDELWMNQLTPMEINVLVEKKYPLIKELLEKVLNLQLEAEEESTMAFELIKFIKSLLEESQLCSQHVQVPLSVLFYIEQFWNTATSKTVNSVKQIHAIIDGYVVVISESSVRSCLLFNDEDGIACLTIEEIFENLALMGYEQLSTKLTFQKGSFSPQ